MKLTKSFEFSASYPKPSGGVVGRNYRLEATTELARDGDEKFFETRIQERLIQKIHSRDFGLHTDFFGGEEITEAALLRIFWKIIEEAIRPLKLDKLELCVDQRTRLTLTS